MTTAPPESSGSTFPDRSDQTSDSLPENSRRFVLIDLTVLEEYDLSPQALALYAHLKKFTDHHTGWAWPKKETLAERLRMRQGRSVDPYITELREAGLIHDVRPRFCNPADRRDWVLDRPDKAHPEQTSNLYVVNMSPASPQVAPGCATTQGGGAPQRTGGVRHNAGEQEPPTNNPSPTTHTEISFGSTSAETTSGAAAAPPGEFSARLIERKRRTGETTPKPMPLHPQWQPNNANRATAKKLGVHLDLAVEQFRKTMSTPGQNRRCWGSAFTKFLKAMSEPDTAPFGVSADELRTTAIKQAFPSAQPHTQSRTEPTHTAESSSEPETRDEHAETPATAPTTRRSTDIDGPHQLKALIWTLEDDGYRGASVRDRVRELFEDGTPTFAIAKLVKQQFVPEPEPLTA
ncbi:helix-turn-helix domain-containing protein [Rhodococcus sp. YH1]|uniref:helix-turn-helix domain-containing protein n=1 Tax=Rhodococcus sp. YH1 TaxID=89066 RepID=UPI00138754B4|nr:hypothetical protein [Rhodococcus sp. YH1]NCL78724.1 hypothetical protein [Rhodococcus sp. YH1]